MYQLVSVSTHPVRDSSSSPYEERAHYIRPTVCPYKILTSISKILAETIDLGRESVLKIRQNIAFSVVAKTLVLMLSLAGITGLAVAVVADVGTALVVILNGMTVLHSEDPGKRNHAHTGGEKEKAPPRSGAWFLGALGGGKGRAVLQDDNHSSPEKRGLSIDKIGLLHSTSDDFIGCGDVELVETPSPAACAKGCCENGSPSGSGAKRMLPFDPAKLQSRSNSPSLTSPNSTSPAQTSEVAVVVAAQAPPSPSRT